MRTAKEAVQGYTKAWTSKDLNATRDYLKHDVSFIGPLQTHDTATGFIAGLGEFVGGMFEAMTPLEEVYEDNRAFLLYDCDLVTGTPLRCAEYFEIEDGLISKIRLIFDTAQIPKPA